MQLKAITAADLLDRVLYRDGVMLVVDKPAGLPVHRGPKGGGSLEDLFDALRFGLPRPPSLAHRLDKDTSGCLVLGRHRKALAHLGLLFKHGKIGKTYWAVVEGGPDAGDGTIDLPLGRLDETRGWWMKPDPHGLPSVTTWKVMGRSAAGALSTIAEPGKRLTWLALTPVTGRTHQLRVHCAASGWPIAGDNIYGSGPRFTGPPQMLHAREVVVPISKNKPPVRIAAPVPDHMRDALRACGWSGEESAQG
jgi:tRNA pseudouridine32 synthase/23S rRNA pseudouridine746 synthase